MKKLNLLTMMVFTIITSNIFAQTYTGKVAQKFNENATSVVLKNGSIQYIEFSKTAQKKLQSGALLKQLLKQPSNNDFVELRSYTGSKGFRHRKYQQFYNNTPVEGAIFTTHEQNGSITSASGQLADSIQITNSILLSASNAQEIGYDAFGSNIDPNVNLDETMLIIVNDNGQYKYAYKVDAYAVNTPKREYIFVDAHNGDIIKKISRIHIIDVAGTATTNYHGTKNITCNQSGSIYTLNESGRGNGINTYNSNGIQSHSSNTFNNTSPIWNNASQQVGHDVHYGTEQTFDYFLNRFQLNSYDGNGATVNSYANYGSNYANAFWDGQHLTYGNGNGYNSTSFTALDVVAHEFTHAVTEFSAGLVYQGESGALNESFSDIFGIAVDFYSHPNTANFLMGDDFITDEIAIRSLANPNLLGNPDTYGGNYWQNGFGASVHNNSGVQNYWFYLLCTGGVGTNDIGNSYNVSGIGIDRAAQIAFRNLTVYLTPNSDYQDARTFSIQSAIDLYGDCSPEVQAVTNAWHAVGVGSIFNESVSAAFTSDKTVSCSSSETIQFVNLSANATASFWSFGDGSTSTLRSPEHTYTSPGQYNVTLTVNGSALCGNEPDTLVQQNYISIISKQGAQASSCNPTSTFSTTYGVSSFSLDSIQNIVTGNDSVYKDFSCTKSTTLTEGVEYIFSANLRRSQNFTLYLDKNNNGIFENPNDIVFLKSNANNNITTQLKLPAGIVKNTPLRLRAVSSPTFDITEPCSNSNNFEAQDYTVTVLRNNLPPIGEFKTLDTVAAPNETVVFNDLTENLPTGWIWYFEGADVPNQYVQNPIVTYSAAGTYDVRLITVNNNGTDTVLKTNYVTIVNEFRMCNSTASTDAQGTLFDSGGESLSYRNSENCTFLINPSCSEGLSLSFESFNTESSYDVLRVYDGLNTSSPLLFTGSGTNLPSDLSSNSGSFFISWRSDGSATRSGFKLKWTSTTANVAPVANFTLPTDTVPYNATYSINNLSTNAFSWDWSFTGLTASTSTDFSPEINFNRFGDKTLKLRVFNCFGADSMEKTVHVLPPPSLALSTQSIDVTALCGDSVQGELQIYSGGPGPLLFSVDDNAPLSRLNVLFIGNNNTQKSRMIQAFSNSTLFPITQITRESVTSQELQTLISNDDINLIVFTPRTSGVSNISALQNTLSSFVNSGGYVVLNGSRLSQFNNEPVNSGLLSINYNGATSSANSSQFSWTTDSIFDGTTSFSLDNNGYFNYYTFNNEPNYVNLVSYSTGSVLGYKTIGSGKAFYWGFDFYYSNTAWNTVGFNLMKEVFYNSSKSSWVSTSNHNNQLIAVGDSATINYTIYSNDFGLGNYTSAIHFETNASQFSIPVNLTVSGQQSLTVPSACIDYGNKMVGTVTTDSITLENSSCEPIIIANISSTSLNWVNDARTVILPPYETRKIEVTFTPDSIGSFNDFLYLTSTAGLDTICLLGQGIGRPIIEISPNPINTVINNCGDSTEVSFWIKNTGQGVLDYDIQNTTSEVYDSTMSNSYGSSNQSIFNFPIAANAFDSIRLTITVNGDFDNTSEYAEYRIENGTFVTIQDNSVTNGIDITSTITLTGAILQSYLTDGLLTLTLRNSSQVDLNIGNGADLHTVRVESIGFTPTAINPYSPATGEVAIGDSTLITTVVSTAGLRNGVYAQIANITSSDPNALQSTHTINYTLLGSSNVQISDTVLDFGFRQPFQSVARTINLTNSGCKGDTLVLSGLDGSNFTTVAQTVIVSPFQTNTTFNIVYNSTTGGISTDTLLLTGVNDVYSIIVTGESALVPNISVADTTVVFNVTSCSGTTSSEFWIKNNGDGILNYNMNNVASETGLESVLTNFQANFRDITNEIPLIYNFLDGTVGNNISDGGGDIFDGGNYINTSAAQSIFYRNNNITNDNSFGTNSRYFTSKQTGIFLLAAETKNISTFSISGNLGADGSGYAQGGSVMANKGNIQYTGHYYQTVNTGDNTVNCLVITKSNPSITRLVGTGTSTQSFSIGGLSNTTELYYLFFSTNSSYQITNREFENIMSAFLDAIIEENAGVTYTPNTGFVTGGDSVLISVDLEYDLSAGASFPNELAVSSNDLFNNPLLIPTQIIQSNFVCPSFNFAYGTTCEGDVAFTNTSTGNAVNFSWDFGDGSVSTTENPVHSYSNAGFYDVVLTTCDNNSNCDADTQRVNIQNIGKPARPSCTPTTTSSNYADGITAVNFGDIANNSPVNTTGYTDFSCEVGTSIEAGTSTNLRISANTFSTDYYKIWIDKNGDGVLSSNEQVTSSSGYNGLTTTVTPNQDYVLGRPLLMRVAMDLYSLNDVTACSVRNGEIEDYWVTITNSTNPPVASFEAITTNCDPRVTFANSSQYGETFVWSFGDGNTSNEVSPTHNYASPGTYTVTLEVTNQIAVSTTTRSFTLNPFLNVDFSSIPSQVDRFQNILFNDAENNSNALYFWNFGDGNNGIGNPSLHNYQSYGTYLASVIISDATTNCNVSREFSIEVVPDVSASEIDKLGVKVFPNPTITGVQVEVNQWEEVRSAQLMNSMGQIIAQRSKNLMNQYMFFDVVTDLAPGTYYVRLLLKSNRVVVIPFSKIN